MYGRYFSDKVVIITGASSGIGRACAFAFSGRGAKVAIASRNEVELDLVRNGITSEHGQCIVVRTDVSVEEDCKNLITKVIEKWGKIDILINNAGISMRADFQHVDIKVLRTLMEVNFWGTVYCTKYALPYLVESKGSLVGISSIAGFKGLPGRSGYSASKFAMHGFLETIRIENIHNKLHVMLVAPGFTASRIRENALDAKGDKQAVSPRDESKLVRPESIARAIITGLYFHRRNLILSWKGKILVLFQRILPKTLDWLAYLEMKREPGSPI